MSGTFLWNKFPKLIKNKIIRINSCYNKKNNKGYIVIWEVSNERMIPKKTNRSLIGTLFICHFFVMSMTQFQAELLSVVVVRVTE